MLLKEMKKILLIRLEYSGKMAMGCGGAQKKRDNCKWCG